MTANEEILKDVPAESQENLDGLAQGLAAPEVRSWDAAFLACVFRNVHLRKTTRSFQGFSKLERMAYVGESLMDKLRNNELRVDASVATALPSTVETAVAGSAANHNCDVNNGKVTL